MSYFDILKRSFEESYNLVNQDDEYYYLYKHVRFDNELHIFDMFKNNKLLYSNPSYFNDPYDCLCKIEYDFSKISKSDLEEIVGNRMTNRHFKERKHIYIRNLKRIHDVKNWGEIGRNGFYVTCFNNSPLNILMWSHYADNHQGFMIELRFKKIMKRYSNLPQPVIYDDNFPILKCPYNLTPQDCMRDNDYGAEYLIKRLLNKAKVWSYEKEFRLTNKADITTNDPSILLDFDPSSLSSVVVGSKIKSKHKIELEKVMREYNKKHNLDVKIFESKLSETEYKLEVKDHPRL